MDVHNQVSMQDFKKALTPLQLKGMQIINVTLGFSILPMLGVVFFLRAMNTSEVASSSDVGLIRLLSFIHVAAALIAYRISGPLFDRTLTRHDGCGKKIGSGTGSGSKHDPAMRIVQAIRSAYIVRLALLEAVAFFGLTICMAAEILGVLNQEPIYWLNTLTSVILIWYALTHFPTEERVEALFREKILHSHR